MIEYLLYPLVGERFKTDARYREGHLRVVNALPERRVLGLHSPEIKQVAKLLSSEGGEVVMPNGTNRRCVNGTEVIRAFESTPGGMLCYEETVVWGYLINLEKCPLDERLAMLARYVPVMDNCATLTALMLNGWRVPTRGFCGSFLSVGSIRSTNLRCVLLWL